MHTYNYIHIVFYSHIHTHTHCMFNMIPIWSNMCIHNLYLYVIYVICNMYIICQYCCQQVELLHYEVLLSSFKLGSKIGKKSRLSSELSKGLRVGGEEQDTEGNRCQGVFLLFLKPFFLDAFRPHPMMPKVKVWWSMLRVWEPPFPENVCKIPIGPINAMIGLWL